MFFTIDQELLVLDKDYIREIPEFRAILVRDKGADGDSQGRKKLQAYRELGYVSFVADRLSLGNEQGLSNETLEANAKAFYGLDKDWKPDGVIKAAIERYIKEYSSFPVIQTLLELRRGQKNIVTALSVFNNRIDSLLKDIESGVDPNKEDYALLERYTDKLESMSKALPNITKNLNNSLEEVKKFEGQVGLRLRTGGHKINPREVHPEERQHFRTE